MQAGIIVRGFIASPSDVQEERERALDVVTKWNAVNSLDRSMTIEAVRVETHAEAQLGSHPQEIINATLLGRCDFLIAIFWSRLGTPTAKEVSGTVDEITTFAKANGGESVKLFFSERDLPYGHDRVELARLADFKEKMKERSLYIPYASVDEFAEKLRNQLDIVMNRIDRSEEKAELWNEHAVLSHLGRIDVERRRHQLEMEKQMDQDHQNAIRQIQERLPKSLG